MFLGHGGVYLTTNVATIACVRKSALYLPEVALLHLRANTTLYQVAEVSLLRANKLSLARERFGLTKKDEESLLFSWVTPIG